VGLRKLRGRFAEGNFENDEKLNIGVGGHLKDALYRNYAEQTQADFGCEKLGEVALRSFAHKDQPLHQKGRGPLPARSPPIPMRLPAGPRIAEPGWALTLQAGGVKQPQHSSGIRLQYPA